MADETKLYTATNDYVFKAIPKFANAYPQLLLWLKFFAASTREEFMSLAQQSPVMDKAWNVIATLNADERERANAEAYDRARWDEFFLREGAFNAGVAEGEARGRAEGKAEGRAEGKAEGRAEGRLTERHEFARAMLAAGKPRAEILQFSRLTEDELDKLQ